MEVLQVLLAFVFLVKIFADDHVDLTTLPGHLKPFGSGRPSHQVEEFDMFPNPTYFFENYVKTLKPLKMKGAAKFSAAFKKWTDEYFLSLQEPSDSTISVETVKKENRKQRVDNMSFQDFVKIYNKTDHYMVDAVPSFIRDDITIPCPLQCEQLAEKQFVDNVMWFSSGGTKSVVHTDNVDNINCLYRGEKTLVFVDPGLHGKNVDLDMPQGAFSSMDVDAVDYTKYPGMADVEFYHVNVSAGDCLYIPYLWIHQVRSYGSNLAVNIWWKHYVVDELNYSTCNDPCDPKFTLDMAHFVGFGDLSESPNEIRDHFIDVIKDDTDFETFQKNVLGMEEAFLQDEQLEKDLLEIFSLLDTNKDGTLTRQETTDVPIKVYSEIAELLGAMEEDMNAIMDEKGIDIDEEGEIEHIREHDDSDEMDLHDEL